MTDYEWTKAWFQPGTGAYAYSETEGWTAVEVLAVTLDNGTVIQAGEYQQRRAMAYPSIADQLDALGKLETARQAGTDAPADALAVVDAVAAVKAAIPKPPDPPWLRAVE